MYSQFCCKYYDAWIDKDNCLYIKQELCHYRDLLDYLEMLEDFNKNILKENFYWDIIFEMICGLFYVHSLGYIHLDIKPSNFFVDEFGTVKIGDFGMSAKLDQNLSDDYEGDCKYLAREVLEAKNLSDFSQKADIFSLGLTILEILFKIDLPQNGIIWNKLRDGNFVITKEFYDNANFNVPDQMIFLIQSMLQPIPENRPSAYDCLIGLDSIKERFSRLQENFYFRSFNPNVDLEQMYNQVIRSYNLEKPTY